MHSDLGKLDAENAGMRRDIVMLLHPCSSDIFSLPKGNQLSVFFRVKIKTGTGKLVDCSCTAWLKMLQSKVQVLYTHNNKNLRIIETIEIYFCTYATTAVLIPLSKQPILTFLLLFQAIIFDMNYLS